MDFSEWSERDHSVRTCNAVQASKLGARLLYLSRIWRDEGEDMSLSSDWSTGRPLGKQGILYFVGSGHFLPRSDKYFKVSDIFINFLLVPRGLVEGTPERKKNVVVFSHGFHLAKSVERTKLLKDSAFAASGVSLGSFRKVASHDATFWLPFRVCGWPPGGLRRTH